MIISDALNYLANNRGQTLRVRYYTATIGSVWDDERTLTQSGNDLYISGFFSSVDGTKGSFDEVLLEEGRISYNDSKMFVNGSIQTTSGGRVFTMSLSGVNIVYREILPGVNTQNLQGYQPYKIVYVRELQTGSLF